MACSAGEVGVARNQGLTLYCSGLTRTVSGWIGTSVVRPTISLAGTRTAAGSVASQGPSVVTVNAGLATLSKKTSSIVSPGDSGG